VSTILKALKKIEEEAPAADQDQLIKHGVDSRVAVKRRIRKNWSWNRWTKIALGVLLLLVTIAWMLTVLRPPNKSRHPIPDIKTESHPVPPTPATTTAKADKTAPKTAMGPQPVTETKPAPRQPTNPQSRTASTATQTATVHQPTKKTAPRAPKTVTQAPVIQPPPASKSAASKKAAPAAVTPHPRTASPPLPPKTAPPKESVAVKTPKTKETAPVATKKKPTPKAAPAPTQRTRPDAPEMKDGKLKLQAVSWSEEASSSLAVINDQIVREGQTVDGHVVVSIGKDDVIVREGGRHWKVVFGKK
jgi:hypothetical protein